MKKYVFINSNGVPLYTASPSTDDVYVSGQQYGEALCVEVPFETNDGDILDTWYWVGGQLKQRPAKPSELHNWDVASESWLPNLDAARKAKLQSVATELNARLYPPCNGFDADEISRERISGMIARLQRGDGLPTGWMGWRDADNNMHWAADDAATVLANLCTLSRAIEDREQALLVAGWTHKANIAALEDIDAILSYDVTKNWPT